DPAVQANPSEPDTRVLVVPFAEELDQLLSRVAFALHPVEVSRLLVVEEARDDVRELPLGLENECRTLHGAEDSDGIRDSPGRISNSLAPRVASGKESAAEVDFERAPGQHIRVSPGRRRSRRHLRASF